MIKLGWLEFDTRLRSDQVSRITRISLHAVSRFDGLVVYKDVGTKRLAMLDHYQQRCAIDHIVHDLTLELARLAKKELV
jgi:hypothetical protein